MELREAVTLIEQGVPHDSKSWADIGAGTGIFTQALQHLLTNAQIYALDKNPHALYRLQREQADAFTIVEGDFNRKMDLPVVDGIIMANALHYAPDPVPVLQNVLSHLKSGGALILVEYDISRPVSTWVPYPVSLARFEEIAPRCGLQPPQLMARRPSRYGRGNIYAAVAIFS